MFITAFIAVVLAVLIGLAIKYYLDRRSFTSLSDLSYQISWREFSAVGVAMIGIAPLVMLVGKELSVANIVTYEEFLNGVETAAVDNVTVCRKGSSGGDENSGRSNCRYEYRTGETYTYTTTEIESYSCTGSDGKPTTCTRPKIVYHTGYIYAPYVTREHRYTIKSSFGFKENEPFHFRTTYIEEDAKPYGNKPIPADLPRGAPADWLDAREHLDRGDPRPVTALAKYDNYILASDDEVLKSYSSDISRYKEEGLLPQHTAGIMSDPIIGSSKSQAQKLSFMDVDVPDDQQWYDAVMRFNAALGMELQGDLHIVVVNTDKVSAQEAVPYLNAVKAYWQGPDFKKRALAKNGIILVLGVSNNSVIEWAETTTGMPFGNELMAQHIRDELPGTELDPTAIFGEPRTIITGDEAKVTLSSPRGVIEQIMFETAPFARASMSCEEEDCVGFKDLLDTIEPTGTQKTVMVVITTILACLLWFLVSIGSFIDDLLSSFLPTRSVSTAEEPFSMHDPFHTSGDGTFSRRGIKR